ncbi:MAG TPA: glycosyl hydrolase family 28 protein [Verrucomicrobiae bacterium]|nr:glycosyl hydrolase family 28 protein [Verrucomicrobiae bacterium]
MSNRISIMRPLPANASQGCPPAARPPDGTAIATRPGPSAGRLSGRGFIVISALALLAVQAAQAQDPPLPVIPATNFNVLSYGAYGDGSFDNSPAINSAISAASAAGGGTVEIPANGTLSTYLSGPITMASGVNLQIDGGAMLQMLPMSTWQSNGFGNTTFIYGSSLSDVEISGSGTIDGQGTNWWYPLASSRPRFVQFDYCNRVLIQNVTLQNPPEFHIFLKNSDTNVTIQGITINTPFDSHNTDGFDISSTNVLIRNSYISDGDDNVEIGGSGAPATGITISNCTFGAGHGLSIGSFTQGGVNNLIVSNCWWNGTEYGIKMKTDRGVGGVIENLKYCDLTMTNVGFPIAFYDYYNSIGAPINNITNAPVGVAADPGQPITGATPIFRNVTVSNLTAVGNSGIRGPANIAGLIYGLPEMPITNVTLCKVNILGRTNDGTVCLYNVRDIRIIDSNLGAPLTGTNVLTLYNAQFTLTNSAPNASTVTMTGLWAPSNSVVSLFNGQAESADTGALGANPVLTLSGSTLTISNNASFGGSSVLNYGLGTNAAETVVTGNLTLAGALNVAAGGGFTSGTYTLFTYGGALTYNGVSIGTVPAGFSCAVSTSTPGLVNLVVGFGAGATLVWTNGSDYWQSTTAWVTNGVGGTGAFPGAGDNAFFTNAATYSVTLSNDVLNIQSNFFNNAGFTAATVTLNLGAYELNPVYMGSSPGAFVVGSAANSVTTVYLASSTVVGKGLVVPGQLVIGRNGSGTLFVTNGNVFAGQTKLGTGTGGSGTIVVSGPNTIWTGTNQVSIGNSSNSAVCSLVISNSASMVATGPFRLGSGSSNGGCSGNTLLLDSNARLYNAGSANIGHWSTAPGGPSYNNAATVQGGAVWDNGNAPLVIGSADGGVATGNVLSIVASSFVTNISYLTITPANTLYMQGGWLGISTATNSGTIMGCGTITGNVVMSAGGAVLANCGGTLNFNGTVTNNGTISAVNGTAVNFFGPVVNNGTVIATNGTVRFYSTFQNNGAVIGVTNSWTDGSGKWETATNWSLTNAPSAGDWIDLITNAANKTVTIDATTVLTNGINGCMTINNLLVSAPSDATNTLFLNNAGTQTPFLLLGVLKLGTNGTMVVNNSAVLGNNSIVVGDPIGTSLVVSNGGSVIVTNSNGTGSVVVNGGSLILGTGTFKTDNLIVTNGGTVQSAQTNRVDNGAATVAGGSLIATNAPTAIGSVGNSVASLAVSSNATVQTSLTTLAAGTNSTASLSVQDVALMQVLSDFTVGSGPGAIGLVAMTGGSLVVTNGVMGIGNDGTLNGGSGTGTMTVSNGTVLANQILLGSSVGGQGQLTVQRGGLVDLIGNNAILVGNDLVVDGGSVSIQNGQIRCGYTHPGAMTMSADNASSASCKLLDVGYDSQGTLTVQSGQLTVSSTLDIGFQAGSTGSVWINGGQVTASGNNTTVGDQGAGQLNFSGGTMQASTIVVGTSGAPGGIGTLTLAGGTLSVSADLIVGTGTVWVCGGQLLAPSGSLVIGSNGVGQLTISNGLVQANSLVLTNGTQSQIALVGGALSSGGTVVTNTQMFVVGNGSSAATFTVSGGTHWFANGLEIRNNASLTGCGTINGTVTVDAGALVVANCGTLTFTGIVTNNGALLADGGSTLEAYGPVVNYGTIDAINGSTNFHAGFVNHGTILTASSVVVSQTSRSGQDFVVQIPSVTGHTYQLQYTTSLAPVTWTNTGASQPGTGSVLTFTDPGATANPQRFYRVLVTAP